MDSKKHIKYLWQQVYDLLNGPGKVPGIYAGHTNYSHLPPKFDSDILNDISALQIASGSNKENLVSIIRTKISIVQVTGLISANDAERIQLELDKLGK